MINHAYTLIYNRRGEHVPKSPDMYDIYIPPYAPIDISDNGGLRAVEDALFMGYPSQDAIRRCLAFAHVQVLHSGFFTDEISAMDPRVTYPVLPEYSPNPLNVETFPAIVDMAQVCERLGNLSASALTSIFEPIPVTGHATVVDLKKARELFDVASTYIDRLDAVLAAYVSALETLNHARSTET